MTKLSFMRWFPNDWLRDTRKLTHLTKAVWADILNFAWNEPERGVYSRPLEQFKLELNLTDSEVKIVLAELSNVGSVTVPNDRLTPIVTVISRRMVKEETAYKLNAERQRRYYNKHKPNAKPNDTLTDKMLDVRRHKRLTSTSSLAQPPPLGGASATREKAGNNGASMAAHPATKVDADAGPEFDHDSFIQRGWRSSEEPTDSFGWEHMERSLSKEERVRSKLREKAYRDKK